MIRCFLVLNVIGFIYAQGGGSALDFDGSDDYVELFAYHNHGSARNAIGNSTTESGFGAFRITGF